MNEATQQPAPTHAALSEKLGQSGLRATRQRELVYDLILRQSDHPTADEVFARAKTEMSSISLATVYNCLETLVRCDLVKPVNFEREPTRYCPNLTEHAHFHDVTTGRVYDVNLDSSVVSCLRRILPEGFEASSVDITFRGAVAPSIPAESEAHAPAAGVDPHRRIRAAHRPLASNPSTFQ